MEIIWLIGGALAFVFFILLVGLVAGRKRASRADRLDNAFERARYARRTGTMGSDRGYIR
ncbi:hypothetical protein [Pyruvatibacter sp.]|uniref:hypothetical protein n=1 Tax=Pyruvatibacter sp. TaxID=1981328 RepID=UPI0032EEA0E8